MQLATNPIRQTHYNILNVKEDATHEEIRSSYRSALLNSHPDKLQNTSPTTNSNHRGPGSCFLDIQKAWEILGDVKSRAVYDRELRVSRQDEVMADEVELEDLAVEVGGDLVELFYQCRCGDYFSLDSLELREMGFEVLREEGHMDISNTHNNNILWFFKHKGFDDKGINEIFRKCKRLESVQKQNLSENWDYLKSIGIQERKLPSIITKCPKIMTLDLNQKLIPMIQCLTTLSTKPDEVSSAITKFPHILTHSIEEKLCPLLGFFESLGVSGTQLGKLLLHNPRIISYSIDSKLSGVVDFLVTIGLTKDGMIGKILVKNPSIMGYNVEKRLRPTSEFLLSLGLTKLDLQKVAINFPEVMCRDVDKILKPNLEYLKSRGFDSGQIASLVGKYPPILIKSVRNSLEPRIRFLVEVMDRGIEEAVNYPEFFHHGLKKRLERRERLLKQRNISCSLSEMLDCNHKKFLSRFDLVAKIA